MTDCCSIPQGDDLYKQYHDTEWGVPIDDDRRFFEKLCLEGFQAGLSWRTILHRRQAFREAFFDFDLERVSVLTTSDVNRLCKNPGIIRNRKKIESAINNARCCLELQHDTGNSLAAIFWRFEPGLSQRPASVDLNWLEHNTFTAESIQLSTLLKQHGFSFVGPTNMYALMQSTGIVNDHLAECYRSPEIKQLRAQFHPPAN